MKTKLIFQMFLLLCVCKISSGQDTISIADDRDANASKNILKSHMDKDIVISRINYPEREGKFYFIKMYRLDEGKLRLYPFGTSASDDYDKATYKWINDTTIIFKLINSSSYKSESFRMTGNGDRSELERR